MSVLSMSGMTLPNKLTLARVVMVPVFMALLSFPSIVTVGIAYVVFVVATITDYYDGKIARERNLITNFGKLLDPVADKVLIAAAFVMLMRLDQLIIPGWTVVVILAREFLVTGARSLAASEGTVIGANIWGKTKAVAQMIYVYVFLFFVFVELVLSVYAPGLLDGRLLPVYRHVLSIASLWAMVFVALLTVYSGVKFATANPGVFRMGQAQ